MTKKSWFFRTLAAIAMLSLVGLVACDKEEKKSDDSAEADKKDDKDKQGAKAKTEDKTKAEEPAPGGAPSKSGFAVFPADSEMLFAVSGTSLRKSSLWDKFKGPLTEPLYASKDWKEFDRICKLNPIEEIESMLVGGKPENEDEILMVIKGLSKSEITACVDKIKKEDPTMKMAEEGQLMKLSAPGQDLYVYWLDDNTFLTAADVTKKKLIAERGAGKDGLDTNKEFIAVLENVDSNATLWFAVVPREGSEMSRDMGNVPGGAPVGVFGSILLEGGLGVDIGARFKSEDQAKMLHAEGQKALPGAKAQAGPMGKYVEKVKLAHKGSDVFIQAKLTQAELDGLIGDLDKMLGGFDKLIKSAM